MKSRVMMKEDNEMNAPIDKDDLVNHVNFRDCTSRLITVNDANYDSVIGWFKSCLRLSKDLESSERDVYELGVIGNVKKGLTEFFRKSELPVSTLADIQKNVASMFEDNSFSSVFNDKEQREKAKSFGFVSSTPEPIPSTCDLEDAMRDLTRQLAWAALASFILVLLISVVLFTLCWLRKCVQYEMAEKLASCAPPPQEEPPPFEEELPPPEDTYDYYGYYYPAKVWMNRLGNAQPGTKRSAPKKQSRTPKRKPSKVKSDSK